MPEIERGIQRAACLIFCWTLERRCSNVAEPVPNAKWWRRSRDRGLAVRWLATAQNLTLTAEGRAANQAKARGTCAPLADELAASGRTARKGDGEWHFGAALMCAGCLVDRRPNRAVKVSPMAQHILCFRGPVRA